MGVKFGEIDVSQILENEFRIGVLESLVEYILNNNQNLKTPSQNDIDQIKHQVAEKLRSKYPNSGIKVRRG